MVLTIPIIASIATYFFSAEINLLKQENAVIKEKYNFLMQEKLATSYSTALSELLAQKTLYEAKINKINNELELISSKLNDSEITIFEKNRLLKQKEQLLVEKNSLLKNMKEELKSTSSEYSQVLVTNKNQEKEINKLNKKISSYIKDKIRIQGIVVSLHQKIGKLSIQATDAQQIISDLKNENESLINSISSFSDEIKEEDEGSNFDFVSLNPELAELRELRMNISFLSRLMDKLINRVNYDYNTQALDYLVPYSIKQKEAYSNITNILKSLELSMKGKIGCSQ